MRCPVCDVDMFVLEFEHVEIDYCHQCSGVWLDSGELEMVGERAGALHAQLLQALDSPRTAGRRGKRPCPVCSRSMRHGQHGDGPADRRRPLPQRARPVVRPRGAERPSCGRPAPTRTTCWPDSSPSWADRKPLKRRSVDGSWNDRADSGAGAGRHHRPVGCRHVQRAGAAAQPGAERLVADRRAAQAPPRPDPEPGRDGEGLHDPRARDAGGRHPGPQPGPAGAHARARRPRPRASSPTRWASSSWSSSSTPT